MYLIIFTFFPHFAFSYTFICGDSVEYKKIEIGMSDESGRSIPNEKFETVMSFI